MYIARTLGSLALALILIVGGWLVLTHFKPTNLAALSISALDKNASDKLLASRTIVDFGYNNDGTVSYTYLDVAVPEKLAENEVPELRTENSYTKFDGVVKEGADPTIQLTSVFYAQPTYVKDVDGTWKYLEYATTTQESFRNRDTTLWTALREVFVRTAYADSVSPFSDNLGDGDISYDDSGGGGALTVCSLEGTGITVDNTDTTALVRVFRNTNSPPGEGSCAVSRVFVPFDTSAIPSGSTVTAASLSVYVTAKVNGDTTGDGLDVVLSGQASGSGLTNGDFGTVGATLFATTLETSTVTTSAHNVLTFNSSGMAAIKFNGGAGCSTGYTCLALREAQDTAGGGLTNGQSNSFTISTSDQTGTSQDPFLSVTYTAGAAAVASASTGIKIGGNGSLRVVGGKLKMQ